MSPSARKTHKTPMFDDPPVPAGTDLCECGQAFGPVGRIFLIFEGIERKWRCPTCADLELFAWQRDLQDDTRDTTKLRNISSTGRA